MDALGLINQFCDRSGLPNIEGIAGQVSQQSRHIRSLLYEVLDSISSTPGFEQRRLQAKWSGVPRDSQGKLSALAPGYTSMVPGTFWDRSDRRPVNGPIAPADWQAIQALPFVGPYYQYIIRGGELLIAPKMIEGHVLAFEYYTDALCLGADGVPKVWPDQNDDTFLMPDRLLIAGLRWKWKYEKGLEYAEDFRLYQQLLMNELATSGTKPAVDLAHGGRLMKPGIFVPGGNWPVSSATGAGG